MAPGKSSLHLSCEGERGIALESRQGNRASRRVEGGISRSFSSCGRKPWLSSTCEGDLRELLIVLIGSQEYCGLGRGLSGLHWVWCSGTGPRLKLRWETLCSSPFLTSIAGSLQSWNRRVRPRLVLRNGTLLSSRVVHRVTGHLSHCIWNLRVFQDDATGVSVPLRAVTSSTGLHSKRCLGIRFLSRADQEIGVFWHVAPPTSYISNFLLRSASS